ncbi:hypothetical protein [Sphingomonas immobilis]|uniref:Uncharacterized protein n=1 Tax=Sphingomonas immobilis TaxID=3063997 RepID=A0ABT8ZWM3_9SPHN|nr:hypothetical protein [Sphingomonas sp. CA1-15]MDO7841980.1 hypothetical protein [Sphingomonas sp. CA1-15]
MSEPQPRPSAREAAMVWLKLLALLAGLAVFGGVIFEIRRSLG